MYVVELTEIPGNITEIPSIKRVLESDIDYPEDCQFYWIGTGAFVHVLKHFERRLKLTGSQKARIEQISASTDTDLMFCPTSNMIQLMDTRPHAFIKSVEAQAFPGKKSNVPDREDPRWYHFPFFGLKDDENDLDISFQKFPLEDQLLCSGQVFVDLKNNRMVFKNQHCHDQFLNKKILTPDLKKIIQERYGLQQKVRLTFLIRQYLKLLYIGFSLSQNDRDALQNLQNDPAFTATLDTKMNHLKRDNGDERYAYIDEMKATIEGFEGSLVDLVLQYDAERPIEEVKQEIQPRYVKTPRRRTLPKYLIAMNEHDDATSIIKYKAGDNNLREIIRTAKNQSNFPYAVDGRNALASYFADALAHCQNTGAFATECAYTALQLHEAYRALSNKWQDETLLKRLRSAAGVKPQTASPTATATSSPVMFSRSGPARIDDIFVKVFALLDTTTIKGFDLTRAKRSDAQIMVHYHDAKGFHTVHSVLRARTASLFLSSFLITLVALEYMSRSLPDDCPCNDKIQPLFSNNIHKAFSFSSLILLLSTIWTYASDYDITYQLAFKSAVENLDNVIRTSPNDEETLLQCYAICLALAEKVENPQKLIQNVEFGFPKQLSKKVFIQLAQTVSITHQGRSSMPEIQPILELLIKVVNFKNIDHNLKRKKQIRLSALDALSQEHEIIRKLISSPEPKLNKSRKPNSEQDINTRFKRTLEQLNRLIVGFHSKMNAGQTNEIAFDDLEQYAIGLYELQLDVKFHSDKNEINAEYERAMYGHQKLLPNLFDYLKRNTRNMPKPDTMFAMWTHPLKAYLETSNYRTQFTQDLEKLKKMTRAEISEAITITKKQSYRP